MASNNNHVSVTFDPAVKNLPEQVPQASASSLTGSVIHPPPPSPQTSSRPLIVAQEEDSDGEAEDVIPGPASPSMRQSSNGRGGAIDISSTLGDSTEHENRKGKGMLASQKDLNLDPEDFAMGCKVLQQAALGNLHKLMILLDEGGPKKKKSLINFRDYDRRTPLHVAASEGHLEICKYLVENGARINRSDRWGGSPLDDASRHRQKDVIQYLRSLGATTGSANLATNFIKAAADGDIDEIEMLLTAGEVKIDEGDYDKRTGECERKTVEWALWRDVT